MRIRVLIEVRVERYLDTNPDPNSEVKKITIFCSSRLVYTGTGSSGIDYISAYFFLLNPDLNLHHPYGSGMESRISSNMRIRIGNAGFFSKRNIFLVVGFKKSSSIWFLLPWTPLRLLGPCSCRGERPGQDDGTPSLAPSLTHLMRNEETEHLPGQGCGSRSFFVKHNLMKSFCSRKQIKDWSKIKRSNGACANFVEKFE